MFRDRLIKKFLNTAVFIIVALALFFGGQIAFAQNASLEIPPPDEDSELLGTQNLKLFGRQIKGTSYRSQEREESIISFYRNFFAKEGFVEILDKMFPQKVSRRTQFRKGNLFIEIILTPTKEGTDVAVATYTLPKGVEKIEDLKLNVNDSIFTGIPAEDIKGEDLEGIPRPPESVRISSMQVAGLKYATYISKIPIEEIRQFYKSKMFMDGWELKNESDVAQIARDYKRITKKKDLGLGKARFPIEGAGDVEEAISRSYILDYKSGRGFVKINIMPNILPTKTETAVVQISFTQEDDERRFK